MIPELPDFREVEPLISKDQVRRYKAGESVLRLTGRRGSASNCPLCGSWVSENHMWLHMHSDQCLRRRVQKWLSVKGLSHISWNYQTMLDEAGIPYIEVPDAYKETATRIATFHWVGMALEIYRYKLPREERVAILSHFLPHREVLHRKGLSTDISVRKEIINQLKELEP